MILTFDYLDAAGRISRRRAWPILCESFAGKVYLFGFCFEIRARRQFRCERMREVAADSSIISDPTLFFGQLAGCRQLATSDFSSSAATAEFNYRLERLAHRPDISDILNSLDDSLPDAEILVALERLRLVLFESGIMRPENYSAAFIERRLAHA